MTCFYCKGNMSENFTTHFAQVGDSFIIIKNVPCYKCERCGEVVYTASVTKRLEQIIAGLEKAFTEIAVINYTAA